MAVLRWKLSNLFADPSVGVNDQKSFEHDLSEQIPKPERDGAAIKENLV